MPAFLKYRSWIGGDWDGNPKATSMMAKQALQVQYESAFARYEEALQPNLRLFNIGTYYVT